MGNIKLVKVIAAAKKQTLMDESTTQVGAHRAKMEKIFNLRKDETSESEAGLKQPKMSKEENVMRGDVRKERTLNLLGTQQLKLEMGERDEKLNEITKLLKQHLSQGK